MIQVMCCKIKCKEIKTISTNYHLAQLVGLLHGIKAAGIREFCSSNPEDSPFLLFFFLLLSFVPFFSVRLRE